jgi:hypothetical protein
MFLSLHLGHGSMQRLVLIGSIFSANQHSMGLGFGDILKSVEFDCYWAHVRSIDYSGWRGLDGEQLRTNPVNGRFVLG